MKKLNKMLLRDIKVYKYQFIAIISIIFIGVTLFSACIMSFNNLQMFKDDFYKNNNFLDGYVTGNNIENTDIEKLKKVDGVKGIEARIELDGRIKIDNRNTLVKVIANKQEPKINILKFNEGNYIKSKDHMLVSKNYAEFNNIELGDKLSVKVLGQDLEFKVVGIVESPEFIITIKSRDYVMPSIEDFGIVYVDYNTIKELTFSQSDIYNQVHFTYKDKEKSDLIETEVEKILGEKFYFYTQREDQISEVMAREDIGMISEIAYMFPVMFFIAAVLVIIVMQKKMIDMQRSTIGVLKAIGYKNKKIIMYYIKQAIVLGSMGSLLSIVPSYYLSIYITKVYCELVYIPLSEFEFYMPVILIAVFLSNFFAILATYFGIREVLKISAAEAMRPAIQKIYNNTPFKGLAKKLKSDNKMVYRNLFRNPIRTSFTIVCYIIAFVLFSVPIFLYETVITAEENQYNNIQNYDYKIVLNKYQKIDEINEIIECGGIESYSKALEMPIEIENNKESKKLKVIGVDSDYILNDGENKFENINELLIPKSISKQLDINKFDDVNIKILMEKDKFIKSRLSDTFNQYVGFSAYISLENLQESMTIDNLINTIYLDVDSSEFSKSKEKIEASPLVKRIDSIEQERKEFKTLLRLVNVFIGVMILFGVLMGIASIYNSTMINVIDRKREWGTLKVMGYNNKRILKMNIKEVVCCYWLSILPCIVISSIISYVVGSMMSNDFYSSPFVLKYNMFVYPLLLVFILSIISIGIYYVNIKSIKTSEIIKIKN